MTDFSWTDERTAELKILWAQGFTCSEIATKLGCISRCAVIGKVHRLDLPGRQRKANANPRPRKPQQRRIDLLTVKPHVRRAPTPLPAPEIVSNPVAFFDLKNHHCRWPVSGEARGMMSCGGEADFPFAPYCSGHSYIAYQAPRTRMGWAA